MIVFLDTTNFHGKYNLESEPIRGLFHFLKISDGKLVVPEVVILEHLKHYHADLQKVINALNELPSKYVPQAKHADVKKLQELPNIISDLEARYEEYFRSKLSSYLPEKYSPTAPDAMQLAKDAVNGKKPFASGSSRGLPDAMIWHEVAQSANLGNETAFISNNHGDFAEYKGSKQLHPDLLSQVSTDASNLCYYHTIVEFLQSQKFGVPTLTEEEFEELNGFDKLLGVVYNEAKTSGADLPEVLGYGLAQVPSITIKDYKVEIKYTYRTEETPNSEVLIACIKLKTQFRLDPVPYIVESSAKSSLIGRAEFLVDLQCSIVDNNIKSASTLDTRKKILETQLVEAPLNFLSIYESIFANRPRARSPWAPPLHSVMGPDNEEFRGQVYSEGTAGPLSHANPMKDNKDSEPQ